MQLVNSQVIAPSSEDRPQCSLYIMSHHPDSICVTSQLEQSIAAAIGERYTPVEKDAHLIYIPKHKTKPPSFMLLGVYAQEQSEALAGVHSTMTRMNEETCLTHQVQLDQEGVGGAFAFGDNSQGSVWTRCIQPIDVLQIQPEPQEWKDMLIDPGVTDQVSAKANQTKIQDRVADPPVTFYHLGSLRVSKEDSRLPLVHLQPPLKVTTIWRSGFPSVTEHLGKSLAHGACSAMLGLYISYSE